MIITFVGHSKLIKSDVIRDSIFRAIIENIIENERILFYCGGYGDFDNLCAKICSLIRKNNPNCELVYVTPYILTESNQSRQQLSRFNSYDSILYPPIEDVPPKYAISKRNEWMVNKADLIIAYVSHTYGGAYKTLKYAQGRKKRIINLAESSCYVSPKQKSHEVPADSTDTSCSFS